jgi:glucan phosphoethanolaminetransferase (alkaline phosphatase superfamily)
MLASVSPSDELLPDWYLTFLFVCFGFASGSALLAVLIRLFWKSQRWISTWLGLAAFVVGWFPVLLSAHIYHIDFVAVRRDGTKASGPLWKALWLPCLPLVLGLFVMLFHKRAPRQKAA